MVKRKHPEGASSSHNDYESARSLSRGLGPGPQSMTTTTSIANIEPGAIVLGSGAGAGAGAGRPTNTPLAPGLVPVQAPVPGLDPVAVEQLSRSDIERIVAEIVLCPDPRPETRQGRFHCAYPEFAEAYPRLFILACSCNTDDARSRMRDILRVMLDQRDMVFASAAPGANAPGARARTGAGTGTAANANANAQAESSTRHIQDMLRARYVDPVLAANPATTNGSTVNTDSTVNTVADQQ